jgi:hypothetical protein
MKALLKNPLSGAYTADVSEILSPGSKQSERQTMMALPMQTL